MFSMLHKQLAPLTLTEMLHFDSSTLFYFPKSEFYFIFGRLFQKTDVAARSLGRVLRCFGKRGNFELLSVKKFEVNFYVFHELLSSKAYKILF